MYPLHHYRLFPPYPVEERVFVAMDFSEKFDRRWETVICPAIESVEINGRKLKAHRVDTSRIIVSVVSEILDGIGRELLVFADITTLHVIDGRALRNVNVLYELGIAHAVRLPEENIIFRSDTDALPFDVANIRVNFYRPEENPAEAREMVSNSIVTALQSLDEQRRTAVDLAAESLDPNTAVTLMLLAANHPPATRPAVPKTPLGDHAAHYARTRPYERLLELGAIRTVWPPIDLNAVQARVNDHLASFAHYEITPFGRAIANRIVKRQFGRFTKDDLERIARTCEETAP